jgi:hypothetical protein
MSIANPGNWLNPGGPLIAESLCTAIHSCLLPTKNVVFWHGRYMPVNFGLFFTATNTVASDEEPKLWPSSNLQFNDPPIIFCAGHTFLADGTLLVAGGERPLPKMDFFRGSKYSFTFKEAAGQRFLPVGGNTNPQEMNGGRWYPSLTRLANGKVVAMSGYDFEGSSSAAPVINPIPEIFDPNTASGSFGWKAYGSSSAHKTINLYPGNHLIPFGEHKGKILYDLITWGNIGDTNTYIFDPDFNSSGFWQIVATGNTHKVAGNSLIYCMKQGDTDAKILNIGGDHTHDVLLFEIGESGITTWRTLPAMMTYGRMDANAIMLPDKNIMILGSEGEHIPELLITNESDNPDDWYFEPLASMFVERKYHSTALLLPNAKVWVGGSRLNSSAPGVSSEFQRDMQRGIQLYEPYYLSDGTRPVLNTYPSSIRYQRSFTVTLTEQEELEYFMLISLPCVTHALDMNQRNIQLEIINNDHNLTYTVGAPMDAYVAPPGYYMLFAVSTKSESESGLSNLPSDAEIIYVH